MRYKPKVLSKAERAEVKRWEEQRRREVEEYERKHLGTKAQRDTAAELYWAECAKEQRRLDAIRNSTSHIPSLKQVIVEIIKPDPLAKLDFEEREAMLKREAAAQEKIKELKYRVAPAYNKGGYVLYTDGMLEGMKTGSHRRR